MFCRICDWYHKESVGSRHLIVEGEPCWTGLVFGWVTNCHAFFSKCFIVSGYTSSWNRDLWLSFTVSIFCAVQVATQIFKLLVKGAYFQGCVDFDLHSKLLLYPLTFVTTCLGYLYCWVAWCSVMDCFFVFLWTSVSLYYIVLFRVVKNSC